MSSQSSSSDPASITITNSSSTTYTATVTYAGSGYKVGNSFRVSGLMLGGNAVTNLLTLTVTTGITANGGLTTASITATGLANSAVSITIPITLDFNSNVGVKDASDITRSIRERLIYNEKRPGSAIVPGGASPVTGRPGATPAGANHLPAGNAEIAWIPQGNQYRLAYLFGKLKCGGGFGGVFSQSGPIQKS